MIHLNSALGRSLRAAATLALVAVPLCGLAGCGDSDVLRSFGLTRDAPNEFVVTTRAPLSMPPDYTLQPPRPGASRPQELNAPNAAAAALVPQAALSPDVSAGSTPGQQALVTAAGPAAPTDIRNKVDADAALDSPGRSLTDRLMFWRTPTPPGVTVDPQREAQRLRDNAALGESPDQGNTAIIQPKQQSILQRLF